MATTNRKWQTHACTGAGGATAYSSLAHVAITIFIFLYMIVVEN